MIEQLNPCGAADFCVSGPYGHEKQTTSNLFSKYPIYVYTKNGAKICKNPKKHSFSSSYALLAEFGLKSGEHSPLLVVIGGYRTLAPPKTLVSWSLAPPNISSPNITLAPPDISSMACDVSPEAMFYDNR